MVIAYHVIFGAYGFWLPNDPRGSWSDFVGSFDLYRFGPATKTDARRSVARVDHDIARRVAAKSALQHSPVQFSGIQARAIGRGFATAAARSHLTIQACSILPDHVHLVLDRRALACEQMVIALKGAAAQRLVAEGLHPFQNHAGPRRPKPFAQGHWQVFLDSPDDVSRAVRYVEENPLKEGKPRQQWSFVRNSFA